MMAIIPNKNVNVLVAFDIFFKSFVLLDIFTSKFSVIIGYL